MQSVFNLITGQSGFLAYLLALMILLLCGLGLPVPEDITLVASGYLSHPAMGVMDIRIAVFVCMFGILAGDTMLFFLGRRLGMHWDRSKRLQKILSAKKMRRARRKFDKHGMKIVFFARFFAGIRAPVFFTAGTLRMSYRTFILLDFLAAAISVPLFIFLGYHFATDIDQALAIIKSGKDKGYLILVVLAVAVLVYILIVRAIRRRDEARNGQGANGENPGSSRSEEKQEETVPPEERDDDDFRLKSAEENHTSNGRGV